MSSPRAAIARTQKSPQKERRLCHRYPLTLRIEYKFGMRGTEAHGFGKTVNISSHGVLFEAEEDQPANGPIDVLMDWPCLRNGVSPVRLVVRGHVVRKDSRFVAVCFTRHEFRSARSSGKRAPRKTKL